MSNLHTFYGMTGASGEGPRLDRKPAIVNPLEVVPLVRNESIISSDLDYDTHMKYWKRLEECHAKFKAFMQATYPYFEAVPRTTIKLDPEPKTNPVTTVSVSPVFKKPYTKKTTTRMKAKAK